MVLAVIFAQRWKVIDARAPAGPTYVAYVGNAAKVPCAKGCRPLQAAVLAWAARPRYPEEDVFPAVSRVIRSADQDCVFAFSLESMLRRDPPQNPFSTLSIHTEL